MEPSSLIQIISVGLITFTVSSIFRHIAKKSLSQAPVNLLGKKILRLNKIYKFAGMIGIAIGIFLIYYYLSTEIFRLRAFLVFFVIALFFTLLGGYLVLCYRNTEVQFDDEIINSWDLFRRHKRMKWKEIKTVKSTSRGQGLTLTSSNEFIEIHLGSVGFKDLENAIMQKLDKNLHEEAFIKVREYFSRKLN